MRSSGGPRFKSSMCTNFKNVEGTIFWTESEVKLLLTFDYYAFIQGVHFIHNLKFPDFFHVFPDCLMKIPRSLWCWRFRCKEKKMWFIACQVAMPVHNFQQLLLPVHCHSGRLQYIRFDWVLCLRIFQLLGQAHTHKISNDHYSWNA